MTRPPQRQGNAPVTPQNVSEETIQRMLALQEARIGLEVKQAEISLREIDHNQKIADKSIEAQAADRADERKVEKTMHLHRLVFGAGVIAMLIVFVLLALWMGKDALVLSLVKVMIGFVGGWGASVAWQRRHRRREQDDDDQ